MGKAADKALFRIDEAAEFVGLSRSRIYELISEGKLELGKMFGRSVIKRENLEALIEENYTSAK